MSINLDPAFWNEKRLIITGGAGFLGSFIIEALKEVGVAETIIPRKAQYDLTDVEAVRQLISDTSKNGAPVDIVIHLAANVGGIGANREHPAEFFYDNLMMGVQLIHESWKAGISKFVATGTICAYPKFTPVPFKEEDIWSGYPEETNAPYGLAKKMMLVQSQAYRDQYGYNSIFVLPVNLYGPRDNFDLNTSHVIPAIIRKCIEARDNDSEEIVLWGDGSPSREFLFVRDACAGILAATEKYNGSDPVNIGSGREVVIKELAEIIALKTGFKGKIVWDTSKPNGQPRRCLDTRLAEEYFGFKAMMPLEDGIAETVEWFENNRDTFRGHN